MSRVSLPARLAQRTTTHIPSRSYSRYNADSILRSEFIYGTGYHGPGGDRTMEAFVTGIEKSLSPGNRVVELGCGLGGPANFLANKYDVKVTGIDISPDMIAECKARQASQNANVDFVCASMADASLFESSSVDLVWTRDAILYLDVDLKRETVDAVAKWLKPKAQFMIGDFGCCAPSSQPWSAGFREYVTSSAMTVIDLDTYTELIQESGKLEVTSVEDRTDAFVKYNKQDLEAFINRRDEFEARFPGPHFEELVARWKLKIAIAEDGSFIYQRIVGHRRS